MLDADYLYRCTDDISALYSELETTIIIDIARRIAKTGKVTATAEWQTIRAMEAGAIYQSVIKEVSKLTQKSENEIKRLFREAGIKSVAYDNRIYEAAGLTPIPLAQSAQSMQVLIAGMLKTNAALKNLTMSTALTAQTKYIQASDLAYMQITSGAFDYNSAIKGAVKTLSKEGITTIDYATGHTDHMDVAVRRTVLTGVNQTALKITELNAEDMGAELVAVSQHWGAREGEGVANHKGWQGKVYGRNGAKGKYPDFVTSTGYGTGPGLGGWNCRHSFYPFFEDSEPPEKMPEKPDVIYGRKRYTYYEATQRQRQIERTIRRWKREKAGMEAAGQPATEANIKIKEWQKEAREFSKSSGITRRPANEQVY